LRKLRSGITVAAAKDEEKKIKEVFKKKYKIPLDFELFSSHAPFYKFPIDEDIIFELTLTNKEDVIFTDTTANMNYKLENICLEYNTITNESIARQLSNNYNSGFSILFDWVDNFKTVSIAAVDTLINENINFQKDLLKAFYCYLHQILVWRKRF
jgi:hypothetical protein